MSSINFATREISCKVVFYGPGLSGKTTNLHFVISGSIPDISKLYIYILLKYYNKKKYIIYKYIITLLLKKYIYIYSIFN